MILLGIETSCDDTAVSLVKDGHAILVNEVESQSSLHSEAYGGVFPEMASRWHLNAIGSVVNRAMEKSGLTFEDIDGIAVTQGPGLIGSLLIGLEFAKGLSFSRNLPLIGVNHLHAHLYGAWMTSLELLEFPLLGLVVSGGHTVIFYMDSWLKITPIATTRDDAVGEAFDKTAKMLSLGYPGGPMIEALATRGDPNAIPFKAGSFKEAPLDFSFSGIKTQVLRTLSENPLPTEHFQTEKFRCDLCASFQKTVLEDVVTKLALAVELTHAKGVLVGGGVACNGAFQKLLHQKIPCKVMLPSPSLSSDNAAMIAGLGYHLAKASQIIGLSSEPYARALDKKIPLCFDYSR